MTETDPSFFPDFKGCSRMTVVLFLLFSFFFFSSLLNAEEYTAVELNDGSCLIARGIPILKKEGFLVPHLPELLLDDGKNAPGRSFSVDRSMVVALRFRFVPDSGTSATSRSESPLEDRWKELIHQTKTSDRIILQKDGTLDYYEGNVIEIENSKVWFRTGESLFALNPSKIVGIAFAKSAVPLSGRATTVLYLTNGGLLYSTLSTMPDSSTMSEKGPLSWRLTNGLAGTLSRDSLLRAEKHFRQYLLTDSQPLSVESYPSETIVPGSRSGHLIRKISPCLPVKNVRVNGVTYRQAIQLTAPCSVTWSVPKDCQRFSMTAGIDSALEAEGIDIQLKYTILLDGLLQEEQTARTGRPAKKSEISLQGKSTLTVRVSSIGPPHPGGILTLVNARFQ